MEEMFRVMVNLFINLNSLFVYFSEIVEEEIGSDDEAKEEVKVESKRSNHFAFIDRASQTKQYDIQETECQTDPPPM